MVRQAFLTYLIITTESMILPIVGHLEMGSGQTVLLWVPVAEEAHGVWGV
jgi:hypothetical protein